MAKVTGIGGVFLKTENKDADNKWYEKNLGIKINEYGHSSFRWRQDSDPEKRGTTEWTHIKSSSGYFGESNSNVMINYRVDNMEEMLVQLKENGVEILGEEKSEYGYFAWVHDNQGNRIELWEPPTDNSEVS